MLLLPSVPAILIHGQEDGIFNISQSRHYANASSLAELYQLPELGHFDMINPRGPVFGKITHALEQLGEKAVDRNRQPKAH